MYYEYTLVLPPHDVRGSTRLILLEYGIEEFDEINLIKQI